MSNIYSQKINETDGVDLIELIRILWTKKLWIIISAFIFMAISAGYAFTAKEQWTSKSVVIAPKVANLGDYLSFRSEYASILDIKDFSQDKVSEKVFHDFKTALFSRSLKRHSFLNRLGLTLMQPKMLIPKKLNKNCYLIWSIKI